MSILSNSNDVVVAIKYVTDTAKAEAGIKKMDAKLAGSTQKFNTSTASILKYGAALSAAAVAIGLVVKGVNDLEKAWAPQEMALKKLEIALNKTNKAYNYKTLVAYSNELQALTNVGDDVTQGMMSMLIQMGMNETQTRKITEGAIGLSKVYDMSLNEAMRKLVEVEEGNVNALDEMIPALRGVKGESEKLAEINRIVENSFDTANEMINTTEGSMTRYDNAIGDLKESAGEFMADIANPIRDGLSQIIEALTETIKKSNEFKDALAFAREHNTIAIEDEIITAERYLEVLKERYKYYTPASEQELADAEERIRLLKEEKIQRETVNSAYLEYARIMAGNKLIGDTSGSGYDGSSGGPGPKPFEYNAENLESYRRLLSDLNKAWTDPTRGLDELEAKLMDISLTSIEALKNLPTEFLSKYKDGVAIAVGIIRDGASEMRQAVIDKAWSKMPEDLNTYIQQKQALRDEEIAKELADIEDAERKKRDMFSETFALMAQGSMYAGQIVRNMFQARIQDAEDYEDSVVSGYDRQIEAAIQAGEDTTELEEQKQEAQARAEKKTKRIKEDAWKAERAWALTSIAMNTASAVSKVWGQTGIFGLAAEIAPLAMGVVQAAAVLSQPMPRFATGTAPGGYLVPPGYNNDSYPVMAQSGERVTVTNGQDAGMPVQVSLIIDGDTLGTVNTKLIRNRQTIIRMEDVA